MSKERGSSSGCHAIVVEGGDLEIDSACAFTVGIGQQLEGIEISGSLAHVGKS